MSTVQYEEVSEPLDLGEGPHWDSENNVLYFVDINGKKICKYDPQTRRYTYAMIERGGSSSILIPIKGQKDKFLATIQRDICVLTWDGESTKTQDIEVIATLNENDGPDINDGKIDASGRLWSGTRPSAEDIGADDLDNVLFSFGKDRAPKVHQRKIGLSNGLCWSADNKLLYYIDSFTYSVDVFDFDLQNGEIANRRRVINLKEKGIDTYPDGMTVDADGNLWVAMSFSKQVVQVDPTAGSLLRSLPVPPLDAASTGCVASVAFGGPNLDEMYVTTARKPMPDQYVDSGCTYRITGVGVKGLPMNPFPL